MIQPQQFVRFHWLRGQFKKRHEAISRLGREPFVMPFWDRINKQILGAFLPKPPSDFLNIRAIKDTMFAAGSEEWITTQINFLKKKLGNDYLAMTKEDQIGKPQLLPPPNHYTSHNTLHHLYHICFFLNQTKSNFADIPSIVEWGGGYGNFAKLWYRLADPKPTYTIIDTALFCVIQWLYLSSVLVPTSVHLLSSKTDKIILGKINIVPLALLDNVKISGNLFVSTWGLSESTKQAQDYVVNQQWFSASHLLIGFQDANLDLKYAARLGELAKKDGAKIINIKFIPKNHYAIK